MHRLNQEIRDIHNGNIHGVILMKAASHFKVISRHGDWQPLKAIRGQFSVVKRDRRSELAVVDQNVTIRNQPETLELAPISLSGVLLFGLRWGELLEEETRCVALHICPRRQNERADAMESLVNGLWHGARV
jgi:hypothetical protein